MDARTDRAWNDFAGDVAVWIDRAGEELAAIAHAHGVKVTRHELEVALESIVGTVEDKHAIAPRPETARTADVLAGFAGMAARVAVDSRTGRRYVVRRGGKLPAHASGAEQWRQAASDTAADAYLDGMAAGARIDAFAASVKGANL